MDGPKFGDIREVVKNPSSLYQAFNEENCLVICNFSAKSMYLINCKN